MDEGKKEEAKKLAARAAQQAKHAASNSAEAAEAAVESVTDPIAEQAEPFHPDRIRFELNDVGKGWLSLSVALAAGAFAARSFKKVWDAKK